MEKDTSDTFAHLAGQGRRGHRKNFRDGANRSGGRDEGSQSTLSVMGGSKHLMCRRFTEAAKELRVSIFFRTRAKQALARGHRVGRLESKRGPYQYFRGLLGAIMQRSKTRVGVTIC